MACLQFQRLMECAKAIEGGNLNVADSLLESIQSQEASESTRKVVKYCVEALVRRVYGIHPLCPSRSLTFLYEPFVMFQPFLEVIVDALNPGNKRLHIIYLSINSDISRWTDFISLLKLRYGGLQSVLITSVTLKRSSQEWDRKVGDVDLEWRQLIYNSPDDIVKCFSKLGRKRKDEMVVVNWDFTIRKLLAQDGAIEQVLSKVKDLEADIMVISEQEANLTSPDLSNRLEQSLQYYSTIFESLVEADVTFMSTETYFRRQIGNVVACEGIDRVERIESFDQWQHRLSQAGFSPVPLQAARFSYGFLNALKGFSLELKDVHIQLSWCGFPLVVASVWKLTDPPQSDSGLCVMQDIVDDPEEMARSSESEDVEENDPCIGRYLWCTQGSAMNRIAALVKLYDILEYICNLYKLPTAKTWISYNREGDTSSNETRILIIDFVRVFALFRLKEGQGVVGKALQSNFHIQHDVYEPHPADFSDFNIESYWQNRSFHASFTIRLTSIHSCKNDYILEFFLPEDMEDTSERERLISKVLCTLQKNFLVSWKIWVTEQNEASGNGVGLDDERISSIPHEAVSSILQLPSSDGGNEFMTTSNQAGETHEPLEQDVEEQFDIDAPALNIENALLTVNGGLQSTNKRRKKQSAIAVPAPNDENASIEELNEASGNGVGLDDERISSITHGAVSSILQLSSSDGGNELMTTNNQAGETHEPLEQDVEEQFAIDAPALNIENALLTVNGGLQSTNKRRKKQSAIAVPAPNDENASIEELNEASGNGVGLDDERISSITHGAVSSILQLSSSDGGNELMTTNNQVGETHEPLEQDVEEQFAIDAPALNIENALLTVNGGLQSTNKRRKKQSAIAAAAPNDENASLIGDSGLQGTNKRKKKQSAITAPALNDENVSLNVDGCLQSSNKRIKRSVVWEHFDEHRGENGEVWATCKHCKKKYKAESKKGTSNLLNHLKRCLSRKQDKAEQQPLILVETGDSSTSVIQRNSVINQERSRLDIVTMIINHGYPLDMVKHEFFEIFVKNLQPMFALQSKVDVEANVLAICRQEKEKLIKYFDSLSCLLSLTLELWSSNDKMMTYCSLTMHFIDDGWQLKKKILAFRNLRYNYDTGTVHEFIKSVLAEWRINKNIHFILLDITPPKEHMIGELRSKVSDKAPLVHGHLFCVSSYAQILSLLVQDGYSEIRSLLYKIRECIEYVNGSSLRRQMLQEAINKGSLQDKEMPFQDVPARWDTTFLMLESSLEFREAFNHLEQSDRDFKVNPSAEEWNKATSICECLKELRKSTSNFPTTSEGYFLSVRDVYKNLLKWEQSEHVYVRSIANRMKGKFDEYWGEASLALGISVVLNPSFKLKLVKYGYQQIYGSEYNLHFSKFLDNVTDIYNKYDQGPSSSAMVDESLCPSSDISFKEWHSQQNELDQYLEQPLEKLDKDGNVLAWWQENAQKFPILGKMARDFLAIPGSTVLSKSSEVMKMTSVHDGDPEMAEALMCGKDWLDN
ncbi:hypothetical protein OIU85_000222 [Salix viminalis]|uniref:BED-type domain-containing protein n=1 Tax=Salix viminalis TaxID=40686 RepID=A0A9Q0VL43_SALVM|nr:hypothetical protein OIU85_000222 [Salix viminalis]